MTESKTFSYRNGPEIVADSLADGKTVVWVAARMSKLGLCMFTDEDNPDDAKSPFEPNHLDLPIRFGLPQENRATVFLRGTIHKESGWYTSIKIKWDKVCTEATQIAKDERTVMYVLTGKYKFKKAVFDE